MLPTQTPPMPPADPIAQQTDLTLTTPEATANFARAVGALLRPGDCLLLEGHIGAGKTHFARHLIQSLLPVFEDVPSPTFTLVQVYDGADCEIWHADLYRLGAPDELEELGLSEALDSAICLIEWPDRMGDLAPAAALTLAFAADPDHEDMRHLRLTWTDPAWTPRLENLPHD